MWPALFAIGLLLMLIGMSTWPDRTVDSPSLTKTGYALGWAGFACVTAAIGRIDLWLIMLSGSV